MRTTQITDAIKSVEVTKTYLNFQKSATVSDPVFLFQLPPKCAIISFYVQIDEPFNLPNSDCKLSTTGNFASYVDISGRKPAGESYRNFLLSPFMHSVSNALNINATVYSFGLGYWESYQHSLNIARGYLCVVGQKSSALSFAGLSSSSHTSVTELSSDGPWSYIGDLNIPRYGAGCSGNSSSVVLAIGGLGTSGVRLNSVERFEIGAPKQEYPYFNNGTWSSVANLSIACTYAAAVGSVNDAIITGGYGTGGAMNTTQRYNGTTWTIDVPLLSNRYSHGIGGVVSNCLIFGGSGVNSASTEIFNGSVWSAGPSLSIGRNETCGAGRLTTGGIICFGGISTFEVAPTEEYQSSTSVWTTTGNMNTPRRSAYGCGSISIGQGGVLATGGSAGGINRLSSSEIYYSSSSSPSVLSGLTAGKVTFKIKYIKYN